MLRVSGLTATFNVYESYICFDGSTSVHIGQIGQLISCFSGNVLK
jgi:hypothetical protein